VAVCEQVSFECPGCGHVFPAVPGSAEVCAQCGRPVAQASGSQAPPDGAGASPRNRDA
jgi:rRNA maturation endonuclease Nob1